MEKVGIQVTADTDAARKALQQLQDLIKEISGNHKMNIDDSNVKSATKDARTLGKEVDDSTRKQRRIKINGNTEEVRRRARVMGKDLDKVTRKRRQVRLDFVSNLGSSLQTMGNTINSIMDSSIVGQFSQGLKQSLFSKLGDVVTSGLDKTVSRYDTMKLFPKTMEAIGFEAKDADKAITSLDKHAQGLPTSLDDLVSVTKRYASTTGDLKKSSNLAIALDNAFLASGANDVQKYQGMNQIGDLLSAGELRSTEWTSLIKSMPVGIREVGKELGYTGKKQKEFTSDLQSGKISADEFVDALIKVGTKGNLVKYADISKESLTAAGKNLSTAVARMGEGVLTQLDKTLKKSTGGGLIEHLVGNEEKGIKGVKGAIDDLGKSIENWVKKHPEKIKAWFDALKNFNWKGLIKGMGTFFHFFANWLSLLSKLSNLGPLGNIAGFMLAGGGKALGTTMQLIGGALRGFGKIGSGIQRMTKAGGKTKKIAKKIPGKKFFLKIKELFSGADAAGSAAKKATTSWKGMAQGLVKSILPGVTALAYTGIIAGVVKIASLMGNTKVSWGKAAKNFTGAAAMMAAASGFMSAIGSLKTFAAGKIASFGKLTSSFKGLGELVTAGITLVDTGVFYLVGKMTESLSNLKLGSLKTLAANFGKISLVIGMMQGLFTGLGAITFIPVVGQILAIADAIGAIETAINTTAFMTVINALKSFQSLDMDNLPTKDDMSKLTTFVKNLSETFGSMDITNKETEQSGKANYLATNLKSIVNSTAVVADKIPTIISNINKAYEAIKQNDWIKDMNSDQIQAIRDAMSAVSNMFLTQEGTEELNAKGNLDPSKNLNAGNLGTKVSKDKATVNGSKNAVGIVENLKKLVADTAAIATNIPKLIENLKTANNAIKENDWISEWDKGPIKNIRDAMTNLIRLATGVGFGGSLLSTSSKTFSYFATNVESLKKGLTSIGSAIDTAKQIKSKIGTIGKSGKEGNDWIAQLTTNISNMMSKLSQAVSGAQKFADNAKALKTGVDMINAAMKAVTDSKSDGVVAFTSALEKLKKKVDEVTRKVQGKGAAWKKQLLDGFRGTASGINNEVSKIGTNLTTDTRKQMFFNAGAVFGSQLVAGMQSSMSGFNMGGGVVQSNVSTGRSTRTIREEAMSRGGTVKPIYRAKGGDSIFRPKGTDTVPAMLTPGEFVHKRRAVKFWGTDFMKKVNSMDLGGAVRALYAKGGMMAPRATVNIDRSKHNNAQVVQNIRSDNPSYSYRRANRYVRGLI